MFDMIFGSMLLWAAIVMVAATVESFVVKRSVLNFMFVSVVATVDLVFALDYLGLI